MDTREFIQALWRGGKYGLFWTDNGRRSFWMESTAIKEPRADYGYNLYFGVHPSACIPETNAAGKPCDPQYVRTQLKTVGAVNCVFADFDTKDASKDELLTRARLLRPTPSVIIDSGGGWHLYWLLDATVIIADDETREYMRNLQRRWVQFVGGDKGAADLTRVLRVPGTRNMKDKYAPDFPVVRFERVLNVRYSLHDITGALPVEKQRTRANYEKRLADGADEYISTHLGSVAHAGDGTRNKTLNRSAFYLGRAVKQGALSESEAEAALLSAANHCGLPENEAARTITSGLTAGIAKA